MSEPTLDLVSLGWDPSWPRLTDAAPALGNDVGGERGADRRPGRIARVDKGICTVLTAAGPVRASLGGDVLDAMAADPTDGPCTGDWCLVRSWPDGPLTVDVLGERRTRILRADASRGSHGQVLAANVDLAAIVVGLHPEPNLSRIERLLTVAWESGAKPLVVLTKADLVVDAGEVAEDVQEAAPGVGVVVCSSVTGLGIDELRARLRSGMTMALIGASGHGKSSLVNALVGVEVLATKEIRTDGKGRHTSVRRELIPVPRGGVLIDTPGLRGVGLQRGPHAVNLAFPDLAALTDECRFSDCRHEDEPGCAIAAAVADGRVSVRRFESWQRLSREAIRAEARTDLRVRAKQARQRRAVTKRIRDQRSRPR